MSQVGREAQAGPHQARRLSPPNAGRLQRYLRDSLDDLHVLAVAEPVFNGRSLGLRKP